jgi:amino-acid N-acetyltransferase
VLSLEDGVISGVCGLEIYSDYGLLRSLTVDKAYRNKGIAGELLTKIETLAKSKKLRSVYLLTKTASAYFLSKGYQIVNRDDVHNEIKQSTEFSHVCPVSAIVMKKNIQ